MNATKPRPTHREELPVRSCRECDAYLSTGNQSYLCWPCGHSWSSFELVDDIWGALAEAGMPQRRMAFEAVQELMCA